MAYFSNNKSKFVSLRKILLIVFVILLTTIHSQGQTSRNIPSDGADRIVRLYPNPATTYITFDLGKGYDKGFSLQVYSFLGKKMTERQNIPQKVTLDLNEYNRGLYMYHLVDASGKVIESGKFQVTK
jgi:Secretion system C-terminal sorting domain